MYILDFSPHHENTTGKDNRVALEANTPTQYRRALAFFKWFFDANFPNADIIPAPDFKQAKRHYHGNTKLYLSCFYNDIIGKYEIHTTSRKHIKGNADFFKFDYIGKLTDYAQTLPHNAQKTVSRF